jgi:uncharacterized protein (TIGR03435 family)
MRQRIPLKHLLSTILNIVAVAGLTSPGAIGKWLQAQSTTGTALTAGVPDWQVAAGNSLMFEAATVKPNTSDDDAKVNFTLGPGDVYANVGGRFVASNISLLDYIRFAYKLTDGQAQVLQNNAPKWLAADRFDIEAKSTIPNPTKDQMRLMMQSLLAERFHLAAHAETRQLPVLALVMAKPGKLGPDIKPHSSKDTCSNIVAPAEQTPEVASSSATSTVCGGLVSAAVPDAPSYVRILGREVPITLLAAHLGGMGQFSRPIIDQTGLEGTFDFSLEWGADASPGSASPPDHDALGTSIQEALLDQLGLKLERGNGPVHVLLIDRIDKQPTAN